MSKRKLLFSEGNVYTSLLTIREYIPIFKEEFDIILITPDSISVRKEANKENIVLYQLPKYDPRKRMEKTELFLKLKDIENKIDYPIQKLIFADPELYNLYRKDEINALTRFIEVFQVYEYVIEKHDISLFCTVGEDRLHNLIPYFLIKKRGGTSFLIRIVPYYGITVTTDFFGKYTNKKNVIISEGVDYEKYVESIKNQNIYFNPIYKSFTQYSIQDLIGILRETVRLNRENRSNIYAYSSNRKLFEKILFNNLKKLIKNLKISFLTKTLYRHLESNQKYIYYPLHYTDDAQIRLRYPEGYNQYELIRNIAKNIPIDYKLIVKEHPHYMGNYSTRELYNLSKLPNVVIVDPRISSKEIFKYIDYIITINSTVGFEGLFWGKVVFTLGHSFYEDFPGVIYLNNINELFKYMSDKHLMEEKQKEIQNYLKIKTIELLSSSIKFNYQDFYAPGNMYKIFALIKTYLLKLEELYG